MRECGRFVRGWLNLWPSSSWMREVLERLSTGCVNCHPKVTCVSVGGSSGKVSSKFPPKLICVRAGGRCVNFWLKSRPKMRTLRDGGRSLTS